MPDRTPRERARDPLAARCEFVFAPPPGSHVSVRCFRPAGHDGEHDFLLSPEAPWSNQRNAVVLDPWPKGRKG